MISFANRLTLLGAAAAAVAGPAAAQYSPQLDAMQRAADLQRWGAAADAQAAYSANDQARTQYNLRQLQLQQIPPLQRPSSAIEDQRMAAQRLETERAQDRAAAAQRQVQEIDGWLARGARPVTPRRP